VSNFESDFQVVSDDETRNSRDEVRKTRQNPSRKPEIAIGDHVVGYAYASAKFGLERTTIWRHEREGKFPKGTTLNGKRVWKKSVLDAFFKSLFANGDNS
jgi:predicted DNA-binding transcriptional regulator AlpA